MGVQALEATSRAEYVVKRLGGDLARASASVAVSSAFHPSMLKDERFCKIRGRDGRKSMRSCGKREWRCSRSQPPYYFSLKTMEHNRALPTRITHSAMGSKWLPPKTLGGNIARESLYFYHNGNATRVIAPFSASSRIQFYSCCSLYYDHGEFWVVPFDATQRRIGNGVDTTAARGYGEDENEDAGSTSQSEDERDEGENGGGADTDEGDWVRPTFCELSSKGESYIGRRQQNRRLAVSRLDQQWATQLFPHGYQARQQTSNRQRGGLVGELPLLLGLMSFSMPPDRVLACLPHCLGNPWQCPPPEQCSQGCGCKFKGNQISFVMFLKLMESRG